MKITAPSELTIECSGRTIYANSGILGLSVPDEEGGGWMMDGNTIAEGYDGDIGCSDWTPEERAEVAAYMCALWSRWAESIS